MGNICRSPAAEGVFRAKIKSEGLSGEVTCDSAGTIDFHAGSSPDARVCQTGAGRGYEIGGRARQVTGEDLEAFDLVLAMDDENLAYVRELDLPGQYQERVRLFCDFVSDSDDRVVPDPYYGGQEGFEKVFDLLEDGCENLLEHVRVEIGKR